MRAMVERFRVERFRCTACRKSWAGKSRAQQHIDNGCIHDPATKACATCEHDEKGYPPTWEEPGVDPFCQVEARPEGERVIRGCPVWEAASWLRVTSGEPAPQDAEK